MKKIILAVAALAAGLPAIAGSDTRGSNVYRHKELGVQFSIPKEGFKLQAQKKSTEAFQTLCVFESEEQDLAGNLLYGKLGLEAEEYAKKREDAWRSVEGVTTFKRLSSKKLDRKPGQWLRREYRMVSENEKFPGEFRLVNLYVSNRGHLFELTIIIGQATWEERAEAVQAILESFQFGAAKTEPRTTKDGACSHCGAEGQAGKFCGECGAKRNDGGGKVDSRAEE